MTEDLVNRKKNHSDIEKGMDSKTKGFTNGMGSGQVFLGSRGLTNGNGMTNGLASPEGFVNGTGVTDGLTNGLVNGMGVTDGLTNGLVNGTGVTNGLTNGLVNGTGVTNGLTNGLAGEISAGVRFDEKAISPKKTSLVIIIVVLLLIPSIFFMYTYDEPVFEGLRVDGDFSEWSDISLYSDTGTASTPALDISNYAVTTNERNDMFIYAQAKGSWMSSTSADSLCVFIDEDDSASTGYTIENMGADYMIEVFGWDNAIQSKQLNGYQDTDQNNWSAWGIAGGLSAAISGDQMEISITSTVHLFGDNAKFMFLTKRGSDIGEICHAQITEGKGALVIEQTPLDVNDVIGSNTIMELELTAYGSPVTVNSISFESSGVSAATVSGLPVTVSVGSPATLNVEAPVTALQQGTYVEVGVSAVTGDGSVNIVGNALKAYANAPPTGINIDGAFADWTIVNKSSDTANDAGNPNVDITNYASVNSTTRAYFYLKVSDSGEIFTGGLVPQARERPETPGEPGEPGEPGTPKPLPRKTGEDITRIYLDTVAGGQNIGGIWADYLIEVKGINGAITSRNLYYLPGKHFVKNIEAANGMRELETGLTLTDIGYTGNLTAYFETTDWENNGDESGTTISQPNEMPGTRGGIIGFSTSKEPSEQPLGGPTALTCWLGDAPTIDGDYLATEWDDADSYTVTGELTVYTKHDALMAYFCVIFHMDSTEGGFLDYGNFHWDTNYNGGTNPQTDDIQYHCESDGGFVNYYEGDGSGWISATAPVSAAIDAAYDSSEGCIVYECSMPLSELDKNGKFGANGETIGFCVVMFDDDTPDWGEWPNDSDGDDPSTWGDLLYSTAGIPEFPTPLIPILVIIAIPLIIRRRRSGGDPE